MKIGIVGCGHVGSASAFACVMRGVGNELVLVDNDPALAVAQAEDILHATPFAKPMAVSAGSFNALAGCGIVMITAGAAQKPGETRLDLLKRNTDIFASIIPEILTAAPGAILLVASNPVDIMTHITARFAAEQGLEPGRVIGSGTILDTARFRTLLAGHLGVSSHSVHAHVLGEHGDSEVLNWSGANVSNINLANFASQLNRPFTGQVKQQIDEGVRKAAYRIIKGKGATWFGIGAGMARIAKAIVSDENSVITCSVPLKEVESVEDVTLSLPHIISSKGATKTIWPVLNEEESKSLQKSAEILKTALLSIGF
jgi:L-lactate dehydrogenase